MKAALRSLATVLALVTTTGARADAVLGNGASLAAGANGTEKVPGVTLGTAAVTVLPADTRSISMSNRSTKRPQQARLPRWPASLVHFAKLSKT